MALKKFLNRNFFRERARRARMRIIFRFLLAKPHARRLTEV